MSPLRVISGQARGHKLRAVPGAVTRPITDRVKEAIFNIISQDLPGSSFLDLFAGTGSVGIEALSRGASFARFIDRHRAAVDTVKANLKATKLGGSAEVLLGDALSYLARPPDRKFEYAFVAPPQYKGIWSQALKALNRQSGWLVSDAWVIVQIDPKEYEELELENLMEFDQRRYGNTMLVFYEHSLVER